MTTEPNKSIPPTPLFSIESLETQPVSIFGVIYGLVPPEAFGPKEFNRLMKVGQIAKKMGDDELNDADVEHFETELLWMVQLIVPDLPKEKAVEIKFIQKLKLANFWMRLANF